MSLVIGLRIPYIVTYNRMHTMKNYTAFYPRRELFIRAAVGTSDSTTSV
jgi:hypothetical protein